MQNYIQPDFPPVNSQSGSHNFWEESTGGPQDLSIYHLPSSISSWAEMPTPGCVCLPTTPPTPLLSPGPQRRDLSPLTRERDILCKLAFFLSQGVFILPSLFLIPDRSYQQKHPRVIDLIQQCKDLPLTPTRGPQKLARGTSQAQRPKFTMSKHGCDHPDSSNRSTGTSNRLLGHLQQTPANHCVLNVFLITPRIESSSRLL